MGSLQEVSKSKAVSTPKLSVKIFLS